MKRDVDISMSLTRLPAHSPSAMWGSIALLIVGTVGYSVATYRNQPAGIKNNGVWFRSLTNLGAVAWIAGAGRPFSSPTCRKTRAATSTSRSSEHHGMSVPARDL